MTDPKQDWADEAALQIETEARDLWVKREMGFSMDLDSSVRQLVAQRLRDEREACVSEIFSFVDKMVDGDAWATADLVHAIRTRTDQEQT